MTTEATPATRSPFVILAALSFDSTGANVLREAARIAELRPDSQLHLVHVVVEEGPASSTSEIVALDRRLERAPAEIRGYVEQVWNDVPRKIVAHLRAGVPSRSILQTAVDLDADLVVVGTHQRQGMEKLWLGSVAEQVLRHAHCPVLVAVPKDYTGKSRSDSIEPPCPKCVAMRQKSHGEQFWCEQHSHAHVKTHVYEPSVASRTSVMPTY
jgi:nucleotide-binding universal stress UspA family protein